MCINKNQLFFLCNMHAFYLFFLTDWEFNIIMKTITATYFLMNSIIIFVTVFKVYLKNSHRLLMSLNTSLLPDIKAPVFFRYRLWRCIRMIGTKCQNTLEVALRMNASSTFWDFPLRTHTLRILMLPWGPWPTSLSPSVSQETQSWALLLFWRLWWILVWHLLQPERLWVWTSLSHLARVTISDNGLIKIININNK